MSLEGTVLAWTGRDCKRVINSNPKFNFTVLWVSYCSTPALQIGILFPILILDYLIQIARRMAPQIRYVKIDHIWRHKIQDRIVRLYLLYQISILLGEDFRRIPKLNKRVRIGRVLRAELGDSSKVFSK